MSNADLSIATRTLHERTVVDEVYMRTPVVEELQRRNQVTYSGGTAVEKLVDTDNIDDLVQSYTATTPLSDARKTTLAKPKFTMKYSQLPLKYDIDEYTQNVVADSEEQLLNLANHLVDKGHNAYRLKLGQYIFNSGSTTGVADSSTDMQSLVSALDHDTTYGTLGRSFSSGTNDYWQGADAAGLNSVVTSSSQATAANLSISNLRKWITETDVMHHMESVADLYVCMCPTLYNKLRAEMEAKLIYKPTGDVQKQGFNKMELDGHTIVSVPYLQTTSTMKLWIFILNLKYWELRIHTARNFELTDFTWQGDKANGYDYWLARIMLCGNIVCWKPNSSLWLSNVT